MNYEQLAALSLGAVVQAVEMVEGSANGFSVQNKSSNRDMVTDLEFVIEKQLSDRLKKSAIQVIGEELSTAETKITDMNWWIDPIDGTNNFIAGLPHFAISVGLVKKNEFLLGVVAAPAMKEIYFTHTESSAFCNGKKLIVKPTALENSLVGCSFSKKVNSRDTDQYALFGKVNELSRCVMRTGSAALNICHVANSKFGAAYGFEAKLWDVAGALAIARIAGCQVSTRFIDDKTIDYVVANTGCFDALVQLTGICL